MRTTNFLLSTVKETPSDATLISHKLMLRAGMIRKLASGIYTWLPLGLRVLKKVENIIREQMNSLGANEILMPSIQPSELWHESQRWDQYGKALLKITDRHDQEFCYGPTHEEVITELARNELKSYKQLPITLYQIQTKFRDEIRPRFGVMRSREFLMKDAYSFHIAHESLQNTYNQMYQAYTNIFSKVGLKFRAVFADNGDMGGSMSQEFQAIAESGEDLIAYSDTSDYAANVELSDLANIKEGDPSPDGHGKLIMARGIEVGQIFQLGTKYSEAMKAGVLDQNGKNIPLIMGCYGIGVSRTVAAAIEQHHDDRGIIWPENIAPFRACIVPIKYQQSESVKAATNKLYEQLHKMGIDVLLDDRRERPGVMFADMDLIGIPHRFVIGEKLLAENKIEYKNRQSGETSQISIDAIQTIFSTRNI